MPAQLNLVNGNITTTLSGNGGSITSGATTFNVASSTGFPAVPFAVVIGSEIIYVTAVVSLAWTVTRGADGSTAATHNDGDSVTWELTKGVLQSLADTFHKSGTLASRPAAGNNGYLYFATDTHQTFLDNGSSWVDVSDLDIAQWAGTALTYRNTMNFQGVGVYAVDSSSPARTDINLLNPRVMSYLFDDFVSGSTSSGTVGELKWGFSGGTVAVIAATSGRVGLIQRATGAVSGTNSYMTVRQVATQTVLWSADLWDISFILKLDQNDSVTEVHMGIADDPTANPPANGVWIKKGFADTSFFGVGSAASVSTLTAALLTCDTSYHYFRVRRVDASTVGFTIDNNAEVTLATGLPSSAAMAPYLKIRNNSAVTKTMTIDTVALQVTALAR